jgi:hypothetical protein
MLTLEECRKYLGNTAISDQELEQLRNSLYLITDLIISQTVEGNGENRSNN